MKNINPTKTSSWNKLAENFRKIKDVKIADLFIQDPKRWKNFSINFQNQILIDFSKNRITQETLSILLELARELDVMGAIKDMFSGKKINCTEDRAVLHIALRNISNKPILLDGTNVMIEVNEVLNKMKDFSHSVINGIWKGYTGKIITDIVNIGIGGSDLGPLMVTEALRPYKNHLNMHFVSNMDGTHLTEILKKINHETTIFLIASKNWNTEETITNANSAKMWFLKQSGNENCFKKHFVALSTNSKAVNKFGIDNTNIFKFWDWVGGRYSLWSSVGLAIMLSIGFTNFKQLLTGAHAMDEHFSITPLENNIPIIMALISIWYNNFFKFETEAILTYDQYMHKFATYLQQSNMESNGKNIDRTGKVINYQTGPIIWGEPGTNGQHSFYQLLHQGTKIVPCDFIAPANTHNVLADHHQQLLANFFAQTKALAFGSSLLELQSDINSEKYHLPFKLYEGNRPTNSILINKITPFTLGALIAMYEHKIFTQGIIWNIFSFDQWGVELGKKLASNILLNLKSKKFIKNYDSSTNNLINCYKSWHIDI